MPANDLNESKYIEERPEQGFHIPADLLPINENESLCCED